MPHRKANPAAPLLAWDRLEIGPPQVEPRRITTPYTVVAGGRRETTELVYKYEEDVFVPGDPAALPGAVVRLHEREDRQAERQQQRERRAAAVRSVGRGHGARG